MAVRDDATSGRCGCAGAMGHWSRSASKAIRTVRPFGVWYRTKNRRAPCCHFGESAAGQRGFSSALHPR